MPEQMRFVKCENLCTNLCPFRKNRSEININEATSGRREIILFGEMDADQMNKVCLECPVFSLLQYYKEHPEA
jgi:hypothetical protein